jgi:catechol 2,3-dioxygenase-like lactoylglutathione lyase family enzyme
MMGHGMPTSSGIKCLHIDQGKSGENQMGVKTSLKWLAKIFAGLAALLAIFILIVFLAPTPSQTTSIDFTRHLSQHQQGTNETAAFFGVPGDARVIITRSDPAISATITLNGTQILGPDSANNLQIEVPVALAKDNSLTVALDEATPGTLTVRVKQLAELTMHVMSRIHYNTNVSNFTEARAFYGSLGFSTASEFPDTNTLAMAHAIGIETPTAYDGAQGDTAGGYLLHGEIVSIAGFGDGVIDLIEFTIPRTEEAPYAQINHLGMAKGTMLTTNIAADYDYMNGIGVNFIAPPTAFADGTKFAIFTDLDGTFYELMEIDGEDAPTDTTHITRLGSLNINVSDFERSAAWYQMMGYDIDRKLPATDSLEVSQAMGFDAPIARDAAILTHHTDDSTVELVQWLKPYNDEAPYPIPVNHFGIHRTAFATADIEADVAALRAQGVEFVSPITPCCSGDDASSSIIAFYDPDGTIVELAGGPIMSKIYTVMQWFSD